MRFTRSIAGWVVAALATTLAVQQLDRPRDRDRSRDREPLRYTQEQAEAWLDLHTRRDDHVVRRLEMLQRDQAEYEALAVAMEPLNDDVADALEDIAEAMEEQAEATTELLEALRDD